MLNTSVFSLAKGLIMLRSLYVVVCGLLLMAGYARAATTINVGPGQTYTTIQSGINAANNGDTVKNSFVGRAESIAIDSMGDVWATSQGD